MPKVLLGETQLKDLQTELDDLRDRAFARVGQQDANHIRKMVRRARVSSATGRGLLMFGFDPFTWVAGVVALAHAKILENMEIGHNVLHGQYDWLNDESLNSQTYEWDIVCTSAHWRRTHNQDHHNHTNILGVDDDYGYGLLRLTGSQKWTWKTLFQPLWYALLAIYFQWGVAIQDLKLGRWWKGRMSKGELAARSGPFVRKARSQLLKDYVLFPLIGFWNWPRIVLGNAAANMIRSLWTNAIIFCGHFTEHAQTFTKAEAANESRGGWYLRQIQGSSNLEGSHWFYLMTGHLSHQIEHHLFPGLPAPRYPEIAPEVRAICAKYGIHYNSAGFWRQYSSVLWRILKYAFPVERRIRQAAPLTAA